MSDQPQDSKNTSETESSGRTLSAGAASGGASAGQIGPYRMLQLLGEGGMGEVWLAEQKAPIQRTVALKLIKAGMDTKAVVARFESERQALALMDHPNIAQVYDAGSTAEGRPYLVMEYVPGLPITEYCDKHRLTMRERLELFMQVCEGVQHAHQKAIIHRDLKPSNVLVVEQDGKAVPKIIDFGLAKATAQRLTDKTLFTELGVLVGTPEYMSPEQADQREQNIDTRTDVYSLGVILYELLVGVLPFETKELRAAGLDAILRVIREQEPPKPSTKVRSMGDGSTAAAQKRREEPRTFARHLRGELDWITLKALEKDRGRRYGTPSEFAADISRYLRSEPVVAGPATKAYLIKKYAARHRVGMTVAGGVLLLIVGFTVTQAIELHRIKQERDRANRERDRAARITDFMTSMFKVSDPGESRGNSITAREILDKASTDIGTGLTKDPELQASMMGVMGEVYDNLGLYTQAESLLERTVDIQSRTLGPKNPDTLTSTENLAWALDHEGRYGEAEKMERDTLEMRRKVLGPEAQKTLASMSELAGILYEEGRSDEAEKLYQQTLEIGRRTLGPEHRYVATDMGNLALIFQDQGRFAEAEKMQRATLEIQRRTLGPENPATLWSMDNLASTLADEGRFADSEKLERETIELQSRILGPEHPDTLMSMSILAADLNDEGRYAEGEKLYREILAIRRRVLGPEHPDTVTSETNLASSLRREGHIAEAERMQRETIGVQRRVFGLENRETLWAEGELALTLQNEGHFAEAEKTQREALDIQRRVFGPEGPDTALSTYNLGVIAANEGQLDHALTLLREAVDHGLSPSMDVKMDQDPDLKSLHGDPRFNALIAHAKEKAGASGPVPKPN